MSTLSRKFTIYLPTEALSKTFWKIFKKSTFLYVVTSLSHNAKSERSACKSGVLQLRSLHTFLGNFELQKKRQLIIFDPTVYRLAVEHKCTLTPYNCTRCPQVLHCFSPPNIAWRVPPLDCPPLRRTSSWVWSSRFYLFYTFWSIFWLPSTAFSSHLGFPLWFAPLSRDLEAWKNLATLLPPTTTASM